MAVVMRTTDPNLLTIFLTNSNECGASISDLLLSEPTFKVTHQAVGHALVEILDTLREFLSTEVLQGQEGRRSYSVGQYIDLGPVL